MLRRFSIVTPGRIVNDNCSDALLELQKAYRRISELEGEIRMLKEKSNSASECIHKNEELRKVCNELNKTTRMYRAAMDLNSAGIALADASDGRILYVNEAGVRYHDKKKIMKNPEMLNYTKLWQMFDLDRQPLPKEDTPFARALHSGEAGSREVIIRNQSDDVWVVLTRFAPIRDENERIIAAAVVFVDVSYIRDAEKSMRALEKKYDRITQFIADAFSLVDMEGHFLEFNKGFTNMLGYTFEEFSRKTYYDITPEKWFSIEEDIVKNQILSRGYSDLYEKEYRKKDGTVFPVELRVFLRTDDNGSPVGMWAIVQDITNRKQAEKRLRDSEAKLKKAQKIAQLGSWDYLPDKRMLWSDEMFKICGVIKEKCNPSMDTFMNIIHSDDRASVMEWIDSLINGFTSTEKEFRILHADGSIKSVSIRGETVCDTEGRPNGISGTLQDITEIKSAQEALIRTNRDLRALSKCNEALVRAENEDILFDDICRIICDDAGYIFAWVGIVDQSMQDILVMRTSTEIKKKGCNITVANNKFWLFPASKVLQGRSSYILDTADNNALEPSWKAFASACGISSIAVLPLIDSMSKVIGALSIYSSEHGVFIDEEVKLLEELAGDLAYGIQTLRLRKEKEIARTNMQEAFREKEILLQELHHRTKNNMQVISSLLEMHAMLSRNAHEKVVFQEMKNRIFAMSLVHEKLYQSKSLSRIDLHEYLDDLSQMLFRSFSELAGKVDLETKIEPMPVTIDIAIPCGLVLNELLSNSLKYAFPENRTGKVTVTLKGKGESEVDMMIKDNGAGKGIAFNREHLNTLGIPLALSIVERQLHGSIQLDTSEGFCWYITFRTDIYRERV